MSRLTYWSIGKDWTGEEGLMIDELMRERNDGGRRIEIEARSNPDELACQERRLAHQELETKTQNLAITAKC
jgi:hypothetical protein